MSDGLILPQPFIFSSKSNGLMELRSSRDTILKLAAVVHSFYHKKINSATSLARPLSFSANYHFAPELIAACWHANVPYLVIPEKPAPAYTTSLARLQPVSYNWQLALEEFIKQTVENQKRLIRDLADNAKLCLPESVFCYVLTSGSSGKPKTVALKRSQMIAAAVNSRIGIQPGANKCWMLSLPLQHIGGASVVLRTWLSDGYVLDARHADMHEIAGQLSANKDVSVVSLVPTQLKKLLDISTEWRTHKEFKAILLGGGPSSSALIQNSRNRGIPVIKSYGMTETCAMIAAVPYSERFSSPPESSGKILPDHHVEVRPLNAAQTADAPSADTTGILWVKGPQVIDSYFNGQDINGRFFDDEGWFCTGDFASIDPNGYISIHMRRSDLVVSGGENVNPADVEEFVLQNCTGIADATAGGIQDEQWGQKLVLLIKTGTGFPGVEKLKQLLSESLPASMVPKKILITDHFPRNEMGKLQQAEFLSIINRDGLKPENRPRAKVTGDRRGKTEG
ncbi:MAG: AMP-binding protein [Balneolales bacterium]|nr:AMP-binding protein [Balneolales bacterium]